MKVNHLIDKKQNVNGYLNGNLICQLINGKGNIKEFYDNGKLKYEGEYLNGERNGKGKEYYTDNKWFQINQWKNHGMEISWNSIWKEIIPYGCNENFFINVKIFKYFNLII